MGAFGIKIPTEYGGLGLSQLTLRPRDGDGHVEGRLARRAAVGAPVDRRAAAAQAVRHRGAEAANTSRGSRRARSRAFALTEVDAGSDPGEHATHRDADRGRQALHPQRREALVHERHARRAVRRDGAHARRRRCERQDAQADHGVHRRGDRARASRSCIAAASWGSRRSRTASSASTTCACRARTSSGAKGRGSSSRSSR